MDDLGIAFKLNEQVIMLWQFYVAWTAGVIGWVFSRKNAWPLQKRIGIGSGILIFNVFNISGLFRNSIALSKVLNAMSDAAYKLPEDVSENVFRAALERLSTGNWYLHIGAHILADIIVFYFIFAVAKQQPSANKPRDSDD